MHCVFVFGITLFLKWPLFIYYYLILCTKECKKCQVECWFGNKLMMKKIRNVEFGRKTDRYKEKRAERSAFKKIIFQIMFHCIKMFLIIRREYILTIEIELTPLRSTSIIWLSISWFIFFCIKAKFVNSFYIFQIKISWSVYRQYFLKHI